MIKSRKGLKYLYKELLTVGYNWKLHHSKLFYEVRDYIN